MKTKTSAVNWRTRAIEAERLAAAHLERISELLTKLREIAAELAEAKEELDEGEIEFAVRDAERDFWLEECDYHRNKRLEDWANRARYEATEAKKKQVTSSGG